ncbi:MAG: hypothetical protein J6A25_04255 [Lachnospiraceae bacterium]|nr:hypothetical protein [Lachnospiraceae bacterium]
MGIFELNKVKDKYGLFVITGRQNGITFNLSFDEIVTTMTPDIVSLKGSGGNVSFYSIRKVIFKKRDDDTTEIYLFKEGDTIKEAVRIIAVKRMSK